AGTGDDGPVRCDPVLVLHQWRWSVFEIDDFVNDCLQALNENEPRRAVREVVSRAVSDTEDVAAALPPSRAGLTVLHNSEELTVLQLVWGPGMQIQPHDHRVWAAIG